MKITTIEIPIYELDIVIVIDTSWEVANKKFKLGLDEDDLKAHAWTNLHPDYNGRHEVYVLLKPNYLDNNTLLHEIYHLISWIAIAKGFTLDANNDEPQAYLQGYLGSKILEFRDGYLSTPERV